MNIWEITPPGDGEWAMITEPYPRSLAFNAELDGRSVLSGWRPPQVKVLHVVGGTRRKHADFPWVSSFALLCRPTALAVVGDLLRAHGEFLPVESDEELIAFNCTVAIAALDLEHSQIERFPSSGRIMVIERHVFDPARLTGAALFRLAELDGPSPIYVSDAFRDRVLAGGVTGLDFRRVWSTDPNAEIPDAFPGW